VIVTFAVVRLAGAPRRAAEIRMQLVFCGSTEAKRAPSAAAFASALRM
jgi:hypothetical protein